MADAGLVHTLRGPGGWTMDSVLNHRQYHCKVIVDNAPNKRFDD